MSPSRCFILTLVLSIVLAVLSCGKDDKNPLGPGNSETPYGAIVATVSDEYGVPIEGAIVLVSSESGRHFSLTDADGMARFENLLPGHYQFATQKRLEQGLENPVDLIKRINEGFHAIDEYLHEGQTLLLSVFYPVDPIDIHVRATECIGGEWLPLANVTLDFDDPLFTVATDGNGHGFIEKLSFDDDAPFFCHTSRNGITGSGRGFLYVRESKLYLDVEFDNVPFSEILYPQDGGSYLGPQVHFSGAVVDFEDGDVPIESYVWSSDLDGALETGNDITTELSIGHHRITLEATDSCDNRNAAGIEIHISLFNENSYFPLPLGGVWRYAHGPIEIITENDRGEAEVWTLGDMVVTLEEGISRRCVMTWTVAAGGEKAACRYVLDDHLDNEGSTFFITATGERLTIYDDNGRYDTPREELQVITSYTPSYTLLVNQCDPYQNNDMTRVFSTEGDITYTIFGIGSHTRAETETVTMSCSVGTLEDATTPVGVFPSIPVKSTYNGIERTWWLAQGIGIVRMEYDLFGETVSASLQETNMADFAGGAGKRAVSFGVNVPVRIQVGSSAGEQERMREIMNIMRGMCPR